MPFKINISDKGKTFKLDLDTEFLVGKKISDKIQGKEIKKELEGYELEITGTSDKAGFPGKKDVEGIALRKILLKKGWGMKTRPRKEGKGKKRRMLKGLRLKKTVRGNTISKDTIQVNMKVLKGGNRKLEEIFPKAGKSKEEVGEPKQEQTKQETEPEKKETTPSPKQPKDNKTEEKTEQPESEIKQGKAQESPKEKEKKNEK